MAEHPRSLSVHYRNLELLRRQKIKSLMALGPQRNVVRGSDRSTDIRLFDVTGEGIAIGEILCGYNGITPGRPTLNPRPQGPFTESHNTKK
jgi:hypothetical protein